MIQKIYCLLHLYNFKQRIQFWFISIILLITLFGYTRTLHLKDFRENEAQINIQQMINLQQLFIEEWLDNKTTEILAISQLPVVKAMNKDGIKQTLETFDTNHAEFNSIVFVNKFGESEIDTSGQLGFNLSDRTYFQEAPKGNSYVSDVLIGGQTHQKVIIFSSPIIDSKQQFQGLIFGTVHLDTVNEVVKKFHSSKTGQTYLVNRDGQLLTEPQFHLQSIQQSAETNPIGKIDTEISRLAMLDKNITQSYRDYRGVTVLGDYRWVNDGKWLIIKEIAMNDVLGPYSRLMKLLMAIILITLLIGLLFTLLISKQIAFPINEVLKGARRMGKAKYEYRIETSSYTHYSIEFQELCETFNEMAGTIQFHMKSVQESEKRYRTLVETSPLTVIVHQDERIVYANPASIRLLKFDSQEDLCGRHILEQVHPDYHQVVKDRIGQLEANKPADLLEEKYILSDGSIIDVEVIATPIEYMNKPAFQVIINDITERKLAEQKLQEANELLQQLSLIDGLTGVHNRRSFDENLEIEWQRSIRNSTPLSLILLDIDYFKEFNDTYGHQDGDECLKQVAEAIKSALRRPPDNVFRYGGEEFGVILPNTDEDGAGIVAENIRITIEKLEITHVGSKISHWVTVSLGTTTTIPTKFTPSTDLIASSDKALYQAKHEGRNCVRSYG